jgi:hypothetical protein
VPGMDFVLTTRYLPLGFHTSIDIGFAIAKAVARSSKEDQCETSGDKLLVVVTRVFLSGWELN